MFSLLSKLSNPELYASGRAKKKKKPNRTVVCFNTISLFERNEKFRNLRNKQTNGWTDTMDNPSTLFPQN